MIYSFVARSKIYLLGGIVLLTFIDNFILTKFYISITLIYYSSTSKTTVKKK